MKPSGLQTLIATLTLSATIVAAQMGGPGMEPAGSGGLGLPGRPEEEPAKPKTGKMPPPYDTKTKVDHLNEQATKLAAEAKEASQTAEQKTTEARSKSEEAAAPSQEASRLAAVESKKAAEQAWEKGAQAKLVAETARESEP
jgi:hypothetical protein